MSFRIGINVGDVIAKDGDIFGDGVNIAVQLQMLASAGGICVSRGVRDHIRHLGSFRFEDLGEQQVKNIDRPVRALSVVVDDTIGSEAVEASPEPPELSTQERAAQAVMLDLAMWQAISGSDQVPDSCSIWSTFPRASSLPSPAIELPP